MNSLLTRITNLSKWAIRRLKNQPDNFVILEKKNGTYWYDFVRLNAEPVGEERSVVHLTLYDMAEHFVMCDLTDLRYLKGKKINAVTFNRFERLDDWHGRTHFQPLYVDPKQLVYDRDYCEIDLSLGLSPEELDEKESVIHYLKASLN